MQAEPTPAGLDAAGRELQAEIAAHMAATGCGWWQALAELAKRPELAAAPDGDDAARRGAAIGTELLRRKCGRIEGETRRGRRRNPLFGPL